MKHFLLSLTAVLFLISCSAAETPTPTITKTAVSHPSPMPTSTVPPPTATQTAVPIPTASATATPEVPTPTITAPTLTPLPTFAPDELETAVDELLADPMTCDVPCWWGAIPGTTTIDEIKHTISPYNFETYEYEGEGEGDVYLFSGLGYTEESGFSTRIVYGFSDGILIGITARIPSATDFLAEYGQPDEIWVSAMNSPREMSPIIWFTIVYLQKDMGINYIVDGDIQSDVMAGCIADETTDQLPLLNMMIPENSTHYTDFTGGIFDKERRYIPLEEATGLTIEEFVQFFSNPSQSQCFETPMELWEYE